ncbi:hypothetical protein PTKIN_Ptkin06aG0115800 [Pterospermum kingtungense]
MKEIEKINPEARKWLDEIPVQQWALAHDGGHCYGIMTTNLSEVFNSVLKGARNLPITACVQLTFYRLVNFFSSSRGFAVEALTKAEVYTPQVTAKLQGYLEKANTHDLVPFDVQKGVFEVITASYGERMQRGHNKQVVRLNEGTCICGKWQIYKFPCSHVMAVCGRLALDSWQYIEDYYSIEKYSQTWAPQFNRIPHESYWPEPNIPQLVPDPARRRSKKGRPQSTRIRTEMDINEGRTSTRYGLCKQPGHDRRTCQVKRHKNSNATAA